jgi:hypothetical protein
MPESKTSYLCDGFYPIHADNVMHAALLFALQMARRRYGPKGRCSRLDLQGRVMPDRATFEAIVGTPTDTKTCHFTVLIEHQDGGN